MRQFSFDQPISLAYVSWLALAMIDEGELDWKVLAISTSDPRCELVNDVGDLDVHFPGTLSAVRYVSPASSPSPFFPPCLLKRKFSCGCTPNCDVLCMYTELELSSLSSSVS